MDEFRSSGLNWLWLGYFNITAMKQFTNEADKMTNKVKAKQFKKALAEAKRMFPQTLKKLETT